MVLLMILVALAVQTVLSTQDNHQVRNFQVILYVLVDPSLLSYQVLQKTQGIQWLPTRTGHVNSCRQVMPTDITVNSVCVCV